MAIHIKPSHRGRLTQRLGTTSTDAIRADLVKAKRTGNVEDERQDVFALNAKGFAHPRKGKRRPVMRRKRPGAAN